METINPVLDSIGVDDSDGVFLCSEVGVSCVICHLSTILTIIMRQFENRCHNSMHYYVNVVSQSVYRGSHVIFLDVLSND